MNRRYPVEARRRCKDKCEDRCGDRCEESCKYGAGINRLDYFHEIVRGAFSEFADANVANNEAMEAISDGICEQKKSMKETQDAMALLEKAAKWLEVYGECYDCNYDSEECQDLLKQIVCLSQEQSELLKYGLHEIKEGLEAWKQANCLENKIQLMVTKYLECVHSEENECRCHRSKCRPKCHHNHHSNWR